jgi:hypothetical protein
MSKTHKNAGRFVALAVLTISLPITLPFRMLRQTSATILSQEAQRCVLAAISQV